MSILSTGVILEVDKPTVNGNVYSHAVLKKAAREFNKLADSRPIFGYFAQTKADVDLLNQESFKMGSIDWLFKINPATVSHAVKDVKLVNGQLHATIQTLSTIPGRMLEHAIKNSTVALRPLGTGKAKGSVIHTYSIVSVGAYDASLVK